MPNWVQNRLTIYGQETEIEKCLLFCKSEDSDFDFNKIVPMPETLDITVLVIRFRPPHMYIPCFQKKSRKKYPVC